MAVEFTHFTEGLFIDPQRPAMEQIKEASAADATRTLVSGRNILGRTTSGGLAFDHVVNVFPGGSGEYIISPSSPLTVFNTRGLFAPQPRRSLVTLFTPLVPILGVKEKSPVVFGVLSFRPGPSPRLLRS